LVSSEFFVAVIGEIYAMGARLSNCWEIVAGIGAAAIRLTRTPRGHPEGWIEAWANLYLELAVVIDARRNGCELAAGLLDYPGVEDGARGMQFFEAVVTSSRTGGCWVELADDFSISAAQGGRG